jgi:uncharacterized surface protein with fasciclin (FAS1) repeats
MMKQKQQYDLRRIGLLAGLILVIGTGCTKNFSSYLAQQTAPQAPLQSIGDYLVNDYNFSLFTSALKRTGLYQQIAADTAQMTLLVPDNDAFARAGITADSLNGMDTASLRTWMAYHIVHGAVTYASVPQTIGNPYQTLYGLTLYFGKPVRIPSTSVLHINGDTVDDFDLMASNGVIQVLNTPLVPPFAGTLQDYLSTPNFSLFKATLEQAGLWNSLVDSSGTETVFAPTNAAYAEQYYFYIDSTQTQLTFFLNLDSVQSWNTAHMPLDIFSAYILPSRIFTTDVSDAPLGYYTPYIMPDGMAAIGLTQNGAQDAMGYTPIGNAFNNNPYYYFAFSNTNISLPANVVTNNGVVQSLDHLLVAPTVVP